MMERTGNTYLSNDNVFQRLICPNPVTCPNEGARISHSAVSEKHKWLTAALTEYSTPKCLRVLRVSVGQT